MNYYLDKSITIKGSLEISGSLIIVKSEKTFNTYKNLKTLSSLIDLNIDIIELCVNGDLIIPEYKNYDFNVLGNTTIIDTNILE